ncbi:MAG: ABC transporter substrate-binding protein [Lachnospiraceae bacterium]|nr:ABC transporter substrate-binding protein [Lachnospiraceae bacterium]
MKKYQILLLTGVIASQLLTGCAVNLPKMQSEPVEIKIGVITDAGDGQNLQQIIEFAQNRNLTEEGQKQDYIFSAVYADAGNTAQSAEAAVQQLQEAGVSAVIALCDGRLAAYAAAAAEDEKLSVIVPKDTDGDAFQNLTNVFRLDGSEVLEAAAAAHYAYYDLGLTTAAVISEESVEGSARFASLFANAYSSYGGRLVIREAVGANTTELQEALTEENPQLVGAFVSADTLASLKKSDGGDTYYLGMANADSQSVLTLLGGSGENLFLPTCVDPENKKTAELRAQFAAWLAEDASRTAAHENGSYMGTEELRTYDAWDLVMQAAVNGGSGDAEKVYAKLVGIDLEGVSGALSFDANLETKQDTVYIVTGAEGEFTGSAEITAADTIA